ECLRMLSTQYSALRTQYSALSTQHSALRTQIGIFVSTQKSLASRVNPRGSSAGMSLRATFPGFSLSAVINSNFGMNLKVLIDRTDAIALKPCFSTSNTNSFGVAL